MPNNKNTRSPNGVGSIDKITVKGHTYWRGRVKVGSDTTSGKPIIKTVTGSTQKEVRQKLTQTVAEVDQGIFTNPTDITVETWFNNWLEVYVLDSLKPKSHLTYKKHTEKHILPYFGKRKLRDLTPPMIQSFAHDLTNKDHLSPNSVTTILAVLKKSLTVAVEQGYIARNPADHVKKPKLKPLRAIAPLTEQEQRNFLKLIHEKDDVYSRLFEVTIFTGMREGEACGLSWNDVDFKRGRIVVRQQLQKVEAKGSEFYIDSTKNDHERVIDLPPYVLAILRRQQMFQTEWREKLGEGYRNEWNLVFTQKNGKNLSQSNVRTIFKRYAVKIGRPDARFHDLRHTFAVNALQCGSDVKTVQEILGHATAAFTLDVYGHVSDRMRKDFVDRLQSVIDNVSRA